MTGFFKVNLQLEEINSVPSAVSGAVILYADATSHKLYARNASGAYILGSMDNPMTTAGDLIVGGADGVPTRMGVGIANYALTVNSGGTGIGYTDGSAIPQVAQNTSDISGLSTGKQDKLTAGTAISISSNVISATKATPNDLGIVKPDNSTISINDGVLSCVVSGGMTNPMTTLGDVIVGGNSGTPSKLGIGTANYVLGVNGTGTSIEYSDGSTIPAVAQNTTDIEALKYQVNIPSDLYLTSTETSTGSGVYVLSLTEPTSVSPVPLESTVSDTEALLFEFEYIFPAAGTIYKDNQYSIALPLSDLSTTASYTLRYVLRHVDAGSTSTNIANFTANAFQPTSTTYTVQEDLPDILASDLAYAAGDKFVLEVYGVIDSGTADCNLVVEDTSLLATLHRQVPVADITAGDVLTTIGGNTITQQTFNETVDTSLSGKMTNPMNTAGDIIIGGSSGVPSRLGIGTAGQILQVNSGASAVEYVDMPIGSTQTRGIVAVDGTTIQSVAGTISVVSGVTSTVTFRYWD